jgi:hypothetical protein
MNSSLRTRENKQIVQVGKIQAPTSTYLAITGRPVNCCVIMGTLVAFLYIANIAARRTIQNGLSLSENVTNLRNCHILI